MVRKMAVILAVFFALVVVSGFVPAWVTESQMTDMGPERTMWGLFKLSLLDDITHGVTAIFLLAGAAASTRAAALALAAFGFYYACDALFFLTFGFFNDLPWTADIALNLPHVLAAAVMLWVANRGGAIGWAAPGAGGGPAAA